MPDRRRARAPTVRASVPDACNPIPWPGPWAVSRSHWASLFHPCVHLAVGNVLGPDLEQYPVGGGARLYVERIALRRLRRCVDGTCLSPRRYRSWGKRTQLPLSVPPRPQLKGDVYENNYPGSRSAKLGQSETASDIVSCCCNERWASLDRTAVVRDGTYDCAMTSRPNGIVGSIKRLVSTPHGQLQRVVSQFNPYRRFGCSGHRLCFAQAASD